MVPAILAASAAYSWFNSSLQASAQRDQAREQDRRLKLQHAQQLGGGLAAGNASGIEADSGSLNAHLSAMTQEFKRQEQWALDAGMTGSAGTQTAGNLGLVTDLGGAFFKYADSQNWFKTPSLEPAPRT